MNYLHSLYFNLTEQEVMFMKTSSDVTRIGEFYNILDKCVSITNEYLDTNMYIPLKTEVFKFINSNLGRHNLYIDPIFRKSLLKDIIYYRKSIPYNCFNDMDIFELSKEIDYIYNIYLDIKDYNKYSKYYND